MKKITLSILIMLIICLATTSYAATDTQNLQITSGACILVEPNTGTIIYEKNSKEKMYPASTTKIMTALLVLENCKLDDTVIVSSSALSEIPDGYVVRRNLS